MNDFFHKAMSSEKLKEEQKQYERIKKLSDEKRNEDRLDADELRAKYGYFYMSDQERKLFDLKYKEARKSQEVMKKMPRKGSLGSVCNK